MGEHLATCPRCGFAVRISSPHTQEIYDRHAEDCPTRTSSEQLRVERRENAKLAFFERKAAERGKDPLTAAGRRLLKQRSA